MFGLAWDIHELEELNSNGRKLRVEVATLSDRLKKHAMDSERDNVALRLTNIRNEVTKFVKGVTRHQRTAATHCLVVMISTEERNKKPYALPVQCIPYKGLKDSEVKGNRQ